MVLYSNIVLSIVDRIEWNMELTLNTNTIIPVEQLPL